VKRTVLLAIAFAAALAWTTGALAREGGKKDKPAGKGRRGQVVTGTLAEATVAGDTVTWKVTADDGTTKELPMATNVVVTYGEKNGQNRVMQIRVAGKKTPEAKGKRLVAQGTLKSVTVAGNKATVTVTVDGADKDFLLAAKVKIACREKAGVTQAMSIGSAGGRKGKGKKKGGDAPANL